jgi:hypothetical protein
MSLHDWFAGAPRWLKSIVGNLTASGRSQSRALRQAKRVERSSASEFEAVPGTRSARYRLKSDHAVVISRNKFRTKQVGVSPAKAAKLRRQGVLEYSGNTAAQKESRAKAASSQRRTRFLKSSRLQRRPDFDEISHVHTFYGTDGVQHEHAFSGRNLAIMQQYRDDWHEPLILYNRDMLKIYATLDIRDISGQRVFPETDLDRLRSYLDRLSARQRPRFEAAVYYLTEAAA